MALKKLMSDRTDSGKIPRGPSNSRERSRKPLWVEILCQLVSFWENAAKIPVAQSRCLQTTWGRRTACESRIGEFQRSTGSRFSVGCAGSNAEGSRLPKWPRVPSVFERARAAVLISRRSAADVVPVHQTTSLRWCANPVQWSVIRSQPCEESNAAVFSPPVVLVRGALL
jgi:hypothetical protein